MTKSCLPPGPQSRPATGAAAAADTSSSSSASGSGPTLQQHLQHLHLSLLSNLSYAALLQADHVQALHVARRVLSMAQVSRGRGPGLGCLGFCPRYMGFGGRGA